MFRRSAPPRGSFACLVGLSLTAAPPRAPQAALAEPPPFTLFPMLCALTYVAGFVTISQSYRGSHPTQL